jgi:hypothetical protein
MVRRDSSIANPAAAAAIDTSGIIPLMCPTDQEEQLLLQFSLQTEETIAPGGDDDGDLEAIENVFQEMVRTHTFCNVDLDVLFSLDDVWVGYLKCLKRQSNATACISSTDS